MPGFSTRRGRPAKARPTTDYGTPELIFKRAYGHTAEAIDLCRERGLITADHHWCGLHLRWLYTLRYGAPNVSATDLTRIDGYAMAAPDDTAQWRCAREAEFAHAVLLLRAHRRYDMVMRVCVFNERPAFLSQARLREAFERPALAHRITQDIAQLTEGLDLLKTLWRKETPRSA